MDGEEVAYIREATGFPGIAMILRIDAEVTRAGTLVRRETRYMITSLDSAQKSIDQIALRLGKFGKRR